MINPDKDEEAIELEEWRRHPCTKRLLEKLREKRRAALGVLVGVCAGSQDPDVAAAYREWQTLKEVLDVVTNEESEGWKAANDDGDRL